MTVKATVADYVASWSEKDADRRHALLSRVWADDGTYKDPNADVTGRDALVAHIGGFHAALPGARIELTSDVSTHHDHIYFSWHLVAADGEISIKGVDFGEIGPDGRIEKIIGFFGPPGA